MVLLHRLDGGEWTEEELNPVKSLEIIPWTSSGVACGVKLALKDGHNYLIDHGHVDGRRII